MSRDRKLKMKEIGELVASYFVSINKLVFLKDDKHTYSGKLRHGPLMI